MTRLGAVGGRAMGALFDQAICSLSNFVVVLASIRFLGLREVGAFALAYSWATLVIVAVRSLILEDLVINFTAVGHAERRQAIRGASGAALVIGALIAAPCWAVAVLGPSAASSTLLVVGLMLPVLLLQDA